MQKMYANPNYPPPAIPGPSGFMFTPPFYMNNQQNREIHPRISAETRKQDEKFINDFIDEENIRCIKKTETKPTLKIFDVRSNLFEIIRLNKAIKDIISELKNENLSESEQNEKLESANLMKAQIEGFMAPLKDGDNMKDVKKRLEKRKKKRLREKRKREAWKKYKEENIEKRARLHLKIDKWIQNKQNIIEKEKREEKLRKDADIVLADVRGKRNDAKKFLAILRELEYLRRTKIKIWRARGENLPLDADDAFNNIIVKLVEQWTALDREYSLEEQGLKLMIKTDYEEKQEKENIRTFHDWEEVIFGQRIPNNAFLRGNLMNFVMIRTMWDQFCNPQGTPIPLGWVIPSPPSSAAWQKVLKKV